jgi:hypothetical protein
VVVIGGHRLGVEARSERTRGLHRGGIAVVENTNAIRAVGKTRAEVRRRDRHRRRAAVQQPLRRDAGGDRSRSRAVVGSEDDDVRLLAQRELAEPVAGGGVDDDATADLGVAEKLRSVFEQGLGGALLEGLTLGVGLLSVADIGE